MENNSPAEQQNQDDFENDQKRDRTQREIDGYAKNAKTIAENFKDHDNEIMSVSIDNFQASIPEEEQSKENKD